MTVPSDITSKRLPAWLRRPLAQPGQAIAVAEMLDELSLNTVCQSAKCPNRGECFSAGTATFLIMGDACTRGCRFCAVKTERPHALDPDEPRRVGEAAARLGLRHVVITTVTRDDLADGGAAHFAATIRAIREALPAATVEVLIPDFQGDPQALETVLAARPEVLNHNLETVPELYPQVRRGAEYARSLELLARASAHPGGCSTKSGLMLGLGETREQLTRVLSDLARIGCEMVTVGQYLRPSRRNLPVVRYVHPDEFHEIELLGRSLGIPVMYCGPLVRSSHDAAGLLK